MSLCTLALAASFLTPNADAGDPPERALDRHEILLRLPRSLPSEPGRRELGTTGDPALDQALAAAGLDRIERVFPEPPRGWTDPVAAREAGLDRWVKARRRDGAEVPAGTVASLRGSGVPHVERPSIGRFHDTLPNDPNFGAQWALQNGILNAPKAWDRVTATSVPVAVLDSGVDLDHPDLSDNRWVNRGEIRNNGIDDDNNGYVDDRKGWDFHDGDRNPEDNLGHGTHTSGTVGARGNNDRQVVGVAWEIPVMTLKIGDLGIVWSNAAEGIVYAADNGAKVISMSWGDIAPIPVVEDALDYAVALDVLPVAAAGNDGSRRRGYPGGYDHVMAVISTDRGDRRSSFSTHGNWCEIAAPGEDILSLAPNGATASQSGTSMACPHVAGVAGVLRHLNPQLDWIDTRWVLNDSTKDLGSAGKDADFGWGRLDFDAAVRRCEMLRIATRSASAGDAVQLDLQQDGGAGHLHVLLASTQGREPGLALSGFDASDTRFLRLNHDAFLFPYILRHPGPGGGVFVRFVESFDAQGQDQATLHVPGGPFFQGRTMSFGFVSFDPADLTKVDAVSNTQTLDIR